MKLQNQFEIEIKFHEVPTDHYTTHIVGSLRLADATLMGQLHASIFRQEDALEDGVSLLSLFDSIDQDTHDVWCAVMDLNTQCSFRKGLGNGKKLDFLSVGSVELLAPYRGLGLGHHFVACLIETFRARCGLVVMEPHPIAADLVAADRPDWHTEMQYEAFSSTKTASKAKLRAHWSKLGFKPVPASRQRYYYLNP